MPKKSGVTITLAAALALAAGATPALAKSGTRSFQSLPSAHAAFSARSNAFGARTGVQSQSRFAAPGVSSQSRFGGGFGGGFGPDNGGNFGGQGNGFGRFGGLGFLFGFLPPNVQQAIADALGNAGPRGERLCRLLGIPECQLPDSTG